MGLEDRLKKLEAQRMSTDGTDVRSRRTKRYLDQYLHAVENARREQDGLEPLPDMPYTEEDYEDDIDTLRETIPRMRKAKGWDNETGRAFCDEWERETRERMERYGR